ITNSISQVDLTDPRGFVQRTAFNVNGYVSSQIRAFKRSILKIQHGVERHSLMIICMKSVWKSLCLTGTVAAKRACPRWIAILGRNRKGRRTNRPDKAIYE